MNKSMKKTRIMAITAMLSAISVIVHYLEFSIPGFLKFDFSFFPALIGTFTMGPISGMSIVTVTQLVRLTTTSTQGIGELANILMGCGFVGVSGLIYHFKKTRGGAVIGMASGTVVMAIVAAFANYFILLPFYENIFPIEEVIKLCGSIVPIIHTKLDVILYYVIPFNLIKGLIISLLTFAVYKPLSPVIHGKV